MTIEREFIQVEAKTFKLVKSDEGLMISERGRGYSSFTFLNGPALKWFVEGSKAVMQGKGGDFHLHFIDDAKEYCLRDRRNGYGDCLVLMLIFRNSKRDSTVFTAEFIV